MVGDRRSAQHLWPPISEMDKGAQSIVGEISQSHKPSYHGIQNTEIRVLADKRMGDSRSAPASRIRHRLVRRQEQKPCPLVSGH